MPDINSRLFGAAFFGALMAALIMGSVVLFIRGDKNTPVQVLLPSPEQIDAITDSRGAAPFDRPETAADLKIYVSGAVRNPGVYTLPPGARLWDAVEAAGGTTLDASEGAVNLAQPLRDGQQYHVPRLGETALSRNNQRLESTGPGGNQILEFTGPGYCDDLIDLNSASKDLLETLPGIGKGRAGDIVSFREEFGPFQSVAAVTNVLGIGEATLEKILALVTVCNQR